MSSTSTVAPEVGREAARARLSLDLDLRSKNQIESLRLRTGATSLTEVIKKALALYDLVQEHTDNGGALILRNADGTEERLRLL